MKLKKLYPENWFDFKVLDAANGMVEEYCAVFNNVDYAADRVQYGFFDKAVAQQQAGQKFPVIYSHQWDNLNSWIGETVELEQVKPGDTRLPAKLRKLGGLRSVWRAFMDEPDARKVVKLLSRGLLRQGSFSYDVNEERRSEDGLVNDLISGDLIELGPTLRGMNDMTDTVGVKSIQELDEIIRGKALDDSAWDKDKAMGACNSAADYRSICAGEKDVGKPEERQHWALPHHYLGKPANAAGVAAARARFDQTQGLTNKGAARTHLFETHKLPSDTKSDPADPADPAEASVVLAKVGRVISSKNESKLRSARDAIDEVLASLGDAPEEGKAEEPQAKAEDPPALKLRRERLAAL